MIKAIETEYSNHRFRSRNEARWAIYFDAIGVKWEYEPEGFVLSDGSTYLPDFLFPDYKCYGEVKPTGFEKDPRHHRFVTESGKTLLLFVGPPSEEPNEIFWHEPLPEDHPFNSPNACHWDGRAFTKEIMGKDFGIMYFGDVHARDYAILEYAIKKANSARFEHGEKQQKVKPYSGFYR